MRAVRASEPHQRPLAPGHSISAAGESPNEPQHTARAACMPPGDGSICHPSGLPLRAPLSMHPTARHERGARLQVELLARVHGEGLVLVRFPEAGHRGMNLRGADGAEACPPDMAARAGGGERGCAALEDLEADVLALAVAVQPQHDVLAGPGALMQVPPHVCLHACMRLGVRQAIACRPEAWLPVRNQGWPEVL